MRDNYFWVSLGRGRIRGTGCGWKGCLGSKQEGVELYVWKKNLRKSQDRKTAENETMYKGGFNIRGERVAPIYWGG